MTDLELLEDYLKDLEEMMEEIKKKVDAIKNGDELCFAMGGDGIYEVYCSRCDKTFIGYVTEEWQIPLKSNPEYICEKCKGEVKNDK